MCTGSDTDMYIYTHLYIHTYIYVCMYIYIHNWLLWKLHTVVNLNPALYLNSLFMQRYCCPGDNGDKAVLPQFSSSCSYSYSFTRFITTSHKYPQPSLSAGVIFCIALQNPPAVTAGFALIQSSPFEALRLLIEANLCDVGCPIHPGGDEFPLNPTSGRAGNFTATLSITMGLWYW